MLYSSHGLYVDMDKKLFCDDMLQGLKGKMEAAMDLFIIYSAKVKVSKCRLLQTSILVYLMKLVAEI